MMHAILGTALLALSAVSFGVAYLVLRKIRISEWRFGESIVTLVALIWTTLTAFAIVELTKAGFEFHTEAISLGPVLLASLGIVCVGAFGLAGWLIQRSNAGAKPTNFPKQMVQN
jgi:drug/metabolite transporter (DMT)-like permease